MRIDEAQEMMRRVYFERDRVRGIEGTLVRTLEEMEELKEALIGEHSLESVKEEVADVFAWLCSLANLLDIDIASAFFAKYSNSCSKCRKSPCECPE